MCLAAVVHIPSLVFIQLKIMRHDLKKSMF